MTSANTFPNRLTAIDDLSRRDHYHLGHQDECYFIGEYTARKGHSFSATNGLILNLKKSMDRRGRPEWRYKGLAIREASAAFRAALSDEARTSLTFVPVPPSKSKSDPLYDDRLIQIVSGIWPGRDIDVRELVLQPVSTEAVHGQDDRPSPAELRARYTIDRRLVDPPPSMIAIIDDVVTTGAHFVAVRDKLREVYPDIPIVGLFVARRVPETIDFDKIDLEL